MAQQALARWALLAALLNGCGGLNLVVLGDDPDGGHASSSPVNDPFDTIDDMEDMNEFLLPRGGRNGSWAIYNDHTPGATQFPSPGLFVVSEISPPRGTSHYAAKTTGMGFTDAGNPSTGWAQMSAVLLDATSPHPNASDAGNVPPSYDVTSYRGVRFWVRGGGSGTQRVVRFALSDVQTHPAGGLCVSTQCYNTFGKNIELTDQWEQETILFSDLRQSPDWGAMFSAPDLPHVISLNFSFIGPDPFEVWVDDIEFMR